MDQIRVCIRLKVEAFRARAKVSSEVSSLSLADGNKAFAVSNDDSTPLSLFCSVSVPSVPRHC